MFLSDPHIQSKSLLLLMPSGLSEATWDIYKDESHLERSRLNKPCNEGSPSEFQFGHFYVSVWARSSPLELDFKAVQDWIC